MPPHSTSPSPPALCTGVPGPVLCLLLLVPWTLAASCASRASKPAAAPSPAPTAVALPVEIRVGVVRAVGTGERFVLIETPSALTTASLAEGQLLHCRPPGTVGSAATADLRVSREHHQSLVVANVVAGDPGVGAIVYFTPEAPPAAAPAPGPISSVSTAPLSGLFPPR